MTKVGLLCAILILTTAAVPGQDRKLKIFISVDMEGIDGVSTNVQTSPTGREYEQFRHLMTRETNAAIEGAFEAGATEVLVGDSHGDEQNIDIELLDPRVELIRAAPRPLGMMQGIDGSFDAVVFVGYHASEGSASAILSHTFTGQVSVKLNGKPVPEAGFNAAIAGDFNVPVVFLSGDQAISEEAKKLLGPIETVAVKQATGFYSARMMNPEKARTLIREGVKRGIERRRELKPFKLDHPVRVELKLKDILQAELASYLPMVERPAGDTIVYSARDMVEASRILRALTRLH